MMPHQTRYPLQTNPDTRHFWHTAKCAYRRWWRG